MSTQESQIVRGARPVMPKVEKVKATRYLDPNLPRYAWSCFSIDLRHYAGVNYVGDYRERFGPGRDEWRQAIAAKTLIQFIPQTAFANVEVLAVPIASMEEAENEKIMGGYETAMLTSEASNKAMRRVRSTRISPGYIAAMLMRVEERRGMCYFEEFSGEEWAEVEYYFNRILPAGAEELQPAFRDVCETRVPQFGETIFLYQIRDFLRRYNPLTAKLKGMPRKDDDPKKLEAMYRALRGAVERGWAYANATLNSTEANIRKYEKGKHGKETYDRADERFPDAPPPQDLVFLAETNRTPIDLAAVHEAQVLAERSQESVMQGMDKIGEKIGEAVERAVTARQEQSITMEELDRRFAERDAVWQQRMDEVLAQSAPVSAAPEVQPEVPQAEV